MGVTRYLCRCLLERMRVREAEIADIESVIGELATNAVQHAHGRRFGVEMEFYPERVIIAVVDRGQGFCPYDVPPEGTARPDEGGEERFGGWGLPLVRMLSDRVHFDRTDPQGTTVRAEKRLIFEDADAALMAASLGGDIRESDRTKATAAVAAP